MVVTIGKAEILAVLAQNRWFAEQPATLKSALIAQARIVEVARGQWVYGAGDALDGLYAVLSGSVDIMMSTIAEDDVLIDIAPAGQVFGQPSQFGGGPRLVTALANEDSVLLHVPDHTMRQIARDQPAVWRNFTALVSMQLAGALAIAANMIHLPPRARIAARLLFLAGGTAQGGAIVRVTQSQLAELTGLTRKTVNGHLADFAKRRLALPRYGGLQLENLRALRDLAAR